MRSFVEHPLFEYFIILAVASNTILLALDGLFTEDWQVNLFFQMNLAFTIIFTVEMCFKIIALGLLEYIRDYMNVLDGVIVIISLSEIFFIGSGVRAVSAFRSVRIFRSFRVLRVTKLLKSLAFMKVIIGVISRSMQSFVYIALLLSLFIFIYGLLGNQIYDGNLKIEGETLIRTNYETFAESLLTCF